MNHYQGNANKRPRLESLPFSNLLAESNGHIKHHPILSDRKLIVHDLKVERPDLPFKYEQDCWKRLKGAIDSIKENKDQEESLEVLYQLCENLCQYDKAQELYNVLHEECLAIAQLYFDSLHLHLEKDETTYLEKVNQIWKEYCQQMSHIRCLFLYLDRSFALNIKGKSIWTMAMDLFRAMFLQYSQVRTKILQSLLKLVRLERKAMFIDGQQLQSVIRMLLDLNVYQEFETCFLEETRQFYATEGNSLMQSMEMGEYLNHVSTRVHQESTVRVKRYFDKSTKAPLQAIVEEELLTKRVTQVLDKCFSYFHENYLVDELSLLYRLLKKVGQLDICAKYFTNYVKTKGSAILCDTLPLSEKMNTLSTFKKKNEYIVDHSFEGDEQFLDGLKDGTEYFINLRENNTIRLLARHADTVVKSEKMDERQVDQCMFLFHHLQAKDEFEVIFKRDLAKRLLLDTAHRNHERILLAKIKKESGVAFTSKLEGMLRDIKQSSELMQEFNDLSGQFYVNVLTHGFWPAYAPVQVSLPAALQELQDLYTVLYTQKYPRRQLTWQNSLGVCDVYANYPRGAKNITLTLLQAIVLLLFNHDTSLPFTSILQATRFDQVELIRTLQSLTSKEYKLLKKDPEGPIQPTDFFSYNPGFWCEKESFKMTTATLTEVIEKDATLNKTLLLSREQQTDAVIVRIMKLEKQMTHGALIDTVLQQLKFPVTTQELKKRIEILIEKEYLERNAEDGYTYLN